MNELNNNVVPFERPASYWVSRARKCRGRSRLPDAAKMLRQAYLSEQDDGVAVELAAAYIAMGCLSAAERVLYTVLKRSPNCAAAYYHIAMCAFLRHDERLAEDALCKCLHADAFSPYADDAQDMLNNYDWHDEPVRPRSARALAMYDQALDALEEGDTPLATERLSKSLSHTGTPKAFALLGELCLTAGRPKEAFAYISAALKGDMSNVTTALLWCRAVYEATAEKQVVRLMLKALQGSLDTYAQWALYARECCATKNAPMAARALEDAVRGAPQSTELMYILAAVMRASGDTERAKKLLDTILTIDPEDYDARVALKRMPYFSFPFERQRPYDADIAALCAREEITGDARFKRLVHGLTISLGGALSYGAVRKMAACAWARMNEKQRKLCDRSRDDLWPRAFNRYLRKVAGLGDARAPLYREKRGARRVRRMELFIRAKQTWGDVR